LEYVASVLCGMKGEDAPQRNIEVYLRTAR